MARDEADARRTSGGRPAAQHGVGVELEEDELELDVVRRRTSIVPVVLLGDPV
jgi:hypothetical protein